MERRLELIHFVLEYFSSLASFVDVPFHSITRCGPLQLYNKLLRVAALRRALD